MHCKGQCTRVLPNAFIRKLPWITQVLQNAFISLPGLLTAAAAATVNSCCSCRLAAARPTIYNNIIIAAARPTIYNNIIIITKYKISKTLYKA